MKNKEINKIENQYAQSLIKLAFSLDYAIKKETSNKPSEIIALEKNIATLTQKAWNEFNDIFNNKHKALNV